MAADSTAQAWRGLKHACPEVSMKKIRFSAPESDRQSSPIFPGRKLGVSMSLSLLVRLPLFVNCYKTVYVLDFKKVGSTISLKFTCIDNKSGEKESDVKG